MWIQRLAQRCWQIEKNEILLGGFAAAAGIRYEMVNNRYVSKLRRGGCPFSSLSSADSNVTCWPISIINGDKVYKVLLFSRDHPGNDDLHIKLARSASIRVTGH